MTTDHLITVGVFDGFSWIRCEGKGSFLNSPVMKSFGDERVARGERVVVVDLAACTGMDSTFMGTLAGLAARLSTKDGGVLQVAEACERNRRSLEDLGLDFLMQIDPPDAAWRESISQIRDKLESATSNAVLGQAQRAKHVLEAHQVLSGVSDKNARVFENVVDMLKQQVSEKTDSEPHQSS